MSKRTSVIAVLLFIAAAIILGLVLVNRGDGPVAGLILSDKGIASVQAYDNVKTTPANGYIWFMIMNSINSRKSTRLISRKARICLSASIL